MRFFNLIMVAIALCFASSAKAACVETGEQKALSVANLTAMDCLAQTQVLATPTAAPQTELNNTPDNAKRTGLLDHLITKTPEVAVDPTLSKAQAQHFALPASLTGIDLVDVIPAASETPIPVPAPGVMPAGLCLLTGLAAIRKLRQRQA